jgi:hypothetical protein
MISKVHPLGDQKDNDVNIANPFLSQLTAQIAFREWYMESLSLQSSTNRRRNEQV